MVAFSAREEMNYAYRAGFGLEKQGLMAMHSREHTWLISIQAHERDPKEAQHMRLLHSCLCRTMQKQSCRLGCMVTLHFFMLTWPPEDTMPSQYPAIFWKRCHFDDCALPLWHRLHLKTAGLLLVKPSCISLVLAEYSLSRLFSDWYEAGLRFALVALNQTFLASAFGMCTAIMYCAEDLALAGRHQDQRLPVRKL